MCCVGKTEDMCLNLWLVDDYNYSPECGAAPTFGLLLQCAVSGGVRQLCVYPPRATRYLSGGLDGRFVAANDHSRLLILSRCSSSSSRSPCHHFCCLLWTPMGDMPDSPPVVSERTSAVLASEFGTKCCEPVSPSPHV